FEGVGLMIFSRMTTAMSALSAMLAFGLFTHLSCGATYSLVPFVNRRALGGVAGIVGAGGNAGAVAAGVLLKATVAPENALWILGWVVIACALSALAVRFTLEQKAEERRLYADALAQRSHSQPPAALPEAAS